MGSSLQTYPRPTLLYTPAGLPVSPPLMGPSLPSSPSHLSRAGTLAPGSHNYKGPRKVHTFGPWLTSPPGVWPACFSVHPHLLLLPLWVLWPFFVPGLLVLRTLSPPVCGLPPHVSLRSRAQGGLLSQRQPAASFREHTDFELGRVPGCPRGNSLLYYGSSLGSQ